jgi:hypothetical protein
MVRERPSLGTPFGTDGPWLAEILDVLGDLHDLLDARLPRSDAPSKTSEPAPAEAPSKAKPVSEPAPDVAPARAEPVEEPDPDDEPTAAAKPSLREPPPRAGRGSSLKAWQSWADDAEVSYDAADDRDDIIAACELAGVLPTRTQK